METRSRKESVLILFLTFGLVVLVGLILNIYSEFGDHPSIDSTSFNRILLKSAAIGLAIMVVIIIGGYRRIFSKTR